MDDRPTAWPINLLAEIHIPGHLPTGPVAGYEGLQLIGRLGHPGDDRARGSGRQSRLELRCSTGLRVASDVLDHMTGRLPHRAPSLTDPPTGCPAQGGAASHLSRFRLIDMFWGEEDDEVGVALGEPGVSASTSSITSLQSQGMSPRILPPDPCAAFDFGLPAPYRRRVPSVG